MDSVKVSPLKKYTQVPIEIVYLQQNFACKILFVSLNALP